MTTTFSASHVSIRSVGAVTNWFLLLLMVLIWAECMLVCNCSVIKRSDVNDLVERNSEKTDPNSDDEQDAPAEKIQSQLMNCYPVSSCYDVRSIFNYSIKLIFELFLGWQTARLWLPLSDILLWFYNYKQWNGCWVLEWPKLVCLVLNENCNHRGFRYCYQPFI